MCRHDASQSVIESLVPAGKPVVIETQQVQDRDVVVVNVKGVMHDVVPPVFASPIYDCARKVSLEIIEPEACSRWWETLSARAFK